MRLEQLRYLIEIANSKSINKAAHNLYITQPALSIAINSLEEELNYPLLTRTKKGRHSHGGWRSGGAGCATNHGYYSELVSI